MSGVLMLCPSAAWGGAERMADTLREEALRAGWRCALELPFDARAQWDAATPREGMARRVGKSVRTVQYWLAEMFEQLRESLGE